MAIQDIQMIWLIQSRTTVFSIPADTPAMFSKFHLKRVVPCAGRTYAGYVPAVLQDLFIELMSLIDCVTAGEIRKTASCARQINPRRHLCEYQWAKVSPRLCDSVH